MLNNTTPVTRLHMVNAYLVREDDGLTLVDTAVPRSAKAILAAAEELGAPIVRIVLTHAHVDVALINRSGAFQVFKTNCRIFPWVRK